MEVRTRAHRIIYIVDTITTAKNPDTDGPGGRHDNDFADIRKIAILPTPDELASKDPFLRRAADVQAGDTRSHNLALHTDNQFRLLREDMLRDLREEIQIALSSKKGRRRSLCIDGLSLADVLCDERQPWSLQLQCTEVAQASVSGVLDDRSGSGSVGDLDKRRGPFSADSPDTLLTTLRRGDGKSFVAD